MPCWVRLLAFQKSANYEELNGNYEELNEIFTANYEELNEIHELKICNSYFVFIFAHK